MKRLLLEDFSVDTLQWFLFVAKFIIISFAKADTCYQSQMVRQIQLCYMTSKFLFEQLATHPKLYDIAFTVVLFDKKHKSILVVSKYISPIVGNFLTT